MKRTLRGLACVGLGGAILMSAGCTGRAMANTAYVGKIIMMRHDLGPTTTQSTGDHLHSINASIELDQRAFFDDLDMLYQTERPTRLTRWTER